MKKNLTKILIMTFIISVMTAFSGCNKGGDGDESGSESIVSNSFTYKGDNYPIVTAIIEYDYNESNETYYAYISLGKVDSLGENGHAVFFDIALYDDCLSSGTYNFPNSGTDYIDYGEIAFLENGDDYHYEITSGSLTIKKSGNTYEFTFKFIDENGEDINGRYKGKVEEYGDSGGTYNHFKYDEVNYPLMAAMYVNLGYYENYSGFIFRIIFFGLDGSGDNGQALIFEMLLSTNSLPTGTYYIKNYLTPNMIGYAEISFINYGNENSVGLRSGSINIQKSDNVYVVTFNCNDLYGNPVTGIYKGLIEEYNPDKYSKDLRSSLKKSNKTTKIDFFKKLL